MADAYYVLDRGGTPAREIALQGAVIGLVGDTVWCHYGTGMNSRRYCYSTAAVERTLTYFSNLLGLNLSMIAVPQADIPTWSATHPTTVALLGAVRGTSNYVTLRDVLQDISVRANIGIGVTDDGTPIYTMEYHSDLRLELQGGPKVSFDRPIKRKIKLD
jgi:hypothetical protein